MPQLAITTLQSLLSPHIALGKSRLETLSLIVIAMVSARTVNLSHLACERPGTTRIASTYRRLQRFFQHVRLGPDWSLGDCMQSPTDSALHGNAREAAALIPALLGGARYWELALDRTQWRIGGHDVNYLVLAIVTRRYRVPVLWSVLKGPGPSTTADRIALMRRYLALFGVGSIRMLVADREFIGAEWLEFLNKNNVPFAIRLREDLRAYTAEGHELSFAARLKGCRRTRCLVARLGGPDGPEVAVTARRLGAKDWLIVASNRPGRAPVLAYRRRWAVECLFGDAKTRGLNLEDTRLRDPRKLDLLMGLVALALAWAGRMAADLLKPAAPRRKSHGYFEKSWFRTGFDRIRNLLRTDPVAAIAPWRRLDAIKRNSPRVV